MRLVIGTRLQFKSPTVRYSLWWLVYGSLAKNGDTIKLIIRIWQTVSRIAPLIIAFGMYALGEMFRWKYSEFGLCDGYSTSHKYSCDLFYTSIVGDPLLAISPWLLGVACVVLFFPKILYKRWLIFAAFYLLVAAYVVNTESWDSLVGKENVAMFFGIVMLVVTIIWLLVYLFISRRGSKVT